MTDCYYRRLGPDTFESTDITCSNWDPAIQHGSPPLALLTKAIEAQLVDSGLRIGRLTLDILGAIPVAPVRVRAWVERPGRRISLRAAEMTPADDDRPVARVTAWALATDDTSDVASDRFPPLVEGAARPLPAHWWGLSGYLGSVDFRPSPSRLCDWCAHQKHCPEFGGTPPPYPGWPERLQEGGEDAVLRSGSESAA
ncbi:MAG TPA: acyl-CoA thioesterase domain-containing protein [Mycobacterium sp.]|nr:acyl-CoA thioesterase domain-containing protein [Mycobacterium sp.]